MDLPRRMKGNERVHAYYVYDVVSQCRIGAAYARKKDEALVVEFGIHGSSPFLANVSGS